MGLCCLFYLLRSVLPELHIQTACIEAGKMYSGAYSTGKSFDILRTKYLQVKRACAIYFNDHKQTLNHITV